MLKFVLEENKQLVLFVITTVTVFLSLDKGKSAENALNIFLSSSKKTEALLFSPYLWSCLWPAPVSLAGRDAGGF